MKIYTRTGDKGETSLFNGSRVPKDDLRIELLGNIDELSAFIGLLMAAIDTADIHDELLSLMQSELLTIGAEIANPKNTPDDYKDYSRLVETLEKSMDQMDESLPPLKNFILPGGTIAASHAHVCRTVTRRCERLCVTLSKEISLNPTINAFLNRLSDYFFVLARYLNKQSGVEDVIWKD
jgi:cob(I)alamin adenosyltransferase